MRRLLPALLVGCAPAVDLDGSWQGELLCDVGSVAACDEGIPLSLQLEGDGGEHRSFLPSGELDGVRMGMPGPVEGWWSGPDRVLMLRGDASDPFASDTDAEAWASHTLELRGAPGSVCWSLRWSWLDSAGFEEAGGLGEVTRLGRTCP